MPRDLPESQNFNKELIQRQKEDAVKQKICKNLIRAFVNEILHLAIIKMTACASNCSKQPLDYLHLHSFHVLTIFSYNRINT